MNTQFQITLQNCTIGSELRFVLLLFKNGRKNRTFKAQFFIFYCGLIHFYRYLLVFHYKV